MNADSVGARARLARPSTTGFRDRAARRRTPRASILVSAVLAAAIVPGAALAQSGDPDPRTMTVEELERHVEAQKAALERVRENRDITAEKAREVREALAEREAERAEAEAELEALCREREEIEPGSYEDCAAQIGG